MKKLPSLRRSIKENCLKLPEWLWGMLKVWCRGFWVDLTGPYGYRVCALIIGAYVGLYAMMEARHERQMNRALFERNTFITMVSSGNRSTFITAMQQFGHIQAMSVFAEPLLFQPWAWWKSETPNSNTSDSF